MSDNPTTGEWTVESSETSGWYIAFDKSNGAFIDNGMTARGIASAHNAALAAEVEVGHNTAVALAQQIIKLEDQLAAKQERVAHLERLLDATQSQLAAKVKQGK